MVKKIIAGSIIAISCIACGNEKSGETTEAKPAEATTEKPAATTSASGISKEDYDAGLALIAKSDCFTCHDIDKKLIGPSYKEVAAKYAADTATISMLAGKVISGGAGNWGQVPMTPHPQLSQKDAKQMVKYVMYFKE